MPAARALTARLFFLRYHGDTKQGGIVMTFVIGGIGVLTVLVLLYLCYVLLKEE